MRLSLDLSEDSHDAAINGVEIINGSIAPNERNIFLEFFFTSLFPHYQLIF